MNLTDRAYVRQLLERHSMTLKKSRGQNFLANHTVVEEIASLCGDEELCIIEIGPGVGAMTAELAKLYKKVIAIEVDRDLIPVLEETLGEYDNVEVIFEDAMKIDFRAFVDEKFPGERVCVCANLPYYITSPVIMKLLDASDCFESIVVMIQKEVADRFCAEPDTDDYGKITLAVQYKAAVEKCFSVSAGNFIPPPKVTSTVIKMNIRKEPPVKPVSVENMFKLIGAAFAQRRKTLSNAIKATGANYTKEEIEDAIEHIGFDRNVRGECLGLSDYARLSDILILK